MSKSTTKLVYDTPAVECVHIYMEQCIAASGDSTLNNLITNELLDEGV